jgi:hypothetical protein
MVGDEICGAVISIRFQVVELCHCALNIVMLGKHAITPM